MQNLSMIIIMAFIIGLIVVTIWFLKCMREEMEYIDDLKRARFWKKEVKELLRSKI